jgi:hypothetical protein
MLEAVEAQIVEEEAASVLATNQIPQVIRIVQFTPGYVREQLLSVAQSPQVRTLVSELYRTNAAVGDGGTADFVREQLVQGVVEGHFEKAVGYLNSMNNLLQSGSLSQSDQLLVQVMYADMWDAARAVSVVAGGAFQFIFAP